MLGKLLTYVRHGVALLAGLGVNIVVDPGTVAGTVAAIVGTYVLVEKTAKAVTVPLGESQPGEY